MRQMPHTEIDDYFKSELLGALGGSSKLFQVFLPYLKKESSYGHVQVHIITFFATSKTFFLSIV